MRGRLGARPGAVPEQQVPAAERQRPANSQGLLPWRRWVRVSCPSKTGRDLTAPKSVFPDPKGTAQPLRVQQGLWEEPPEAPVFSFL